MRYLLICFSFLVISIVSGQRQELLDKLSEETCACIEASNFEGDAEMIMGLCAVQAGSTHSDEVKEILGIDLSNTDNYEEFGAILAVSLIDDCPNLMERILGELEIEEGEDLENEEETWSDMEAAQFNQMPEYGGPDNKEFINESLPDTNTSGFVRPSVTGKIRDIKIGLSNKITIRTVAGSTEELYLSAPILNRELLEKGAELTLKYREKELYNAATGQTELIKVIYSIEK